MLSNSNSSKSFVATIFRNDLFRIYAHKSLKELVGIYTKQGQKNLLMRPMSYGCTEWVSEGKDHTGRSMVRGQLYRCSDSEKDFVCFSR